MCELATNIMKVDKLWEIYILNYDDSRNDSQQWLVGTK